MIKWLKSLLDEEPANTAQDTNRMVAALLLEVARADDHIDASEMILLETTLGKLTQLPAEDIKNIIRETIHSVDNAESLHKFTRHINEQFNLEQKKELLLQLWHMAYADGQVDQYEEHIIRRIADLIHLRHSEFIQGKLSAKESQINK
ncbi:MAG: TerB family tellurite resistance protein [Oceanospirillaceae bacterium]|nr:TerB family tellurite resistance protein [Oceanospirillaceae bacterium]